MPLHETKYCPRCQQPFECKAGSISNCQCSDIQLDAGLMQLIREQYADCLCIACLRDLLNIASYPEKNKDSTP
jgi:hypothetical protein